MSTVLRLIWTYFTASRLTRACSGIGLACMLGGIACYAYQAPDLVSASFGRVFQRYDFFVLALPFLGLLLLLVASALMPVIVERVALGRSIWLLPYGRLRLLASVVLPALALALLIATATAALMGALPHRSDYDIPYNFSYFNVIFYRTWLMAFVDLGLINMAIWLVSKTSGVWRLAGLIWVILSITIPMRYLGGVHPPFSSLEGLGLLSWIVFGMLLLSGGRLRHTLQRYRAGLARLRGQCLPATQYAPGDEAALLLGTNRPWFVAFGQVVPIVVMVALLKYSELWIVILVVFSAISGAFASQAGARSRRLWLRFGWTREQLARRVEVAFWRHNAWSLGVLLVLYVGIALFYEFRVETLVLSLALLIVGATVCTYLGLLITHGLGWFEAALGIVTMLALTLAAIAIMRSEFVVATEFVVALAALAIVYRVMARARWLQLDWMQCRFEMSVRGAG